MHAGSISFASNVLPVRIQSPSTSISTEQLPSDSNTYYKTNTADSLTSSSGYESVVSRSSKSHRSLFFRLKRLINFPSSKKSSDYAISVGHQNNDPNTINSPLLSFRNPATSSKTNNPHQTKRNSFTRLSLKRKSSRRNLLPVSQHIPFLYGLKNCGNTWYENLCFLSFNQSLCISNESTVRTLPRLVYDSLSIRMKLYFYCLNINLHVFLVG